MPFQDVLVHRATPLIRTEGVEYAEGEAETVEGRGVPFACCLFPAQGAESAGGGRSRAVKRPTLLCSPMDDEDFPVALSHEDELLIVAPELNRQEGLPEDAEVRWQVDGTAQAFGKPGAAVIGQQATLRRVTENAMDLGMED